MNYVVLITLANRVTLQRGDPIINQRVSASLFDQSTHKTQLPMINLEK